MVRGSSRKGEMCSNQKDMLVCFFDHKGTVHYEFIAQGQTMLFGIAENVMVICSEKRTRNLA
jgi:hypothetical protein